MCEVVEAEFLFNSGDLIHHLLETVVAEIRKIGVRALPLTLDVASAADRQRMIAETLVTFNRLDVLVNNAAIQRIAMPWTRKGATT